MKSERKQEMAEIQTILAVVLTKVENIETNIAEIRNGIGTINGGLRENQKDVVAIKTRCTSCKDDLDDLKKRMNIFSTLAIVCGGILGYLGSYFK